MKRILIVLFGVLVFQGSVWADAKCNAGDPYTQECYAQGLSPCWDMTAHPSYPTQSKPWVVGEALIKPDGTTTGFDSQWQRWQQKLPKENRFAERSLRNLVGSEDDLLASSERLGHASTATTKKFYRNKPTEVFPLSSHKTGC